MELKYLLSFLLFLDQTTENDPQLSELAEEIKDKTDLSNKLVSFHTIIS